MNTISKSGNTDSETELMNAIHKYADAGGSVIQVRTREPIRAALTLRKHLVGSDTPYKEWDIVNGFRVFTRENLTEHRLAGDAKDFYEAFLYPLMELRNPTSEINGRQEQIHFFVYMAPQPFIAGNPPCLELLQQYAAILPSTNVCTILVTPDVALPDVPVGTVLVTEMSTPTVGELLEVLKSSLEKTARDTETFPNGIKLKNDELMQIATMGLGLSLYEFETYLSIAIIDYSLSSDQKLTADHLLSGIAKGKTTVVKQSEILELTHAEDIENVGGMGRLKDWIAARAGCYSDEAKEFGIEPPKGMVLVGVPGTGKSLVAKVTASVLGVPLVKLDFGRVFSKYVGDSESRVRSALNMVENMAPVVLFVDEVDKGLGGAEGSSDSGVSSRVLGSFLTWLQECKAPVFTVVTANRVNGLPPELLRRGRFDQVFSVAMPNPEERREVLEIHLRKRGRDIAAFSAAEINEFLRESEGYVPAEIESAVKDALVAAYNDTKCEDIEMRHIVDALHELVPMSKAHKDNIDRILAWATQHATPVSYPPKIPAPAGNGEDDGTRGVRVIRTRRR